MIDEELLDESEKIKQLSATKFEKSTILSLPDTKTNINKIKPLIKMLQAMRKQ